MAALARSRSLPAPQEAAPQYQLRIRRHGAGDHEMEVWQLPGPATPQLPSPRRIAGLRGRNRSHIQGCLQGIEAMAREEAAYWLGMALYRKYPRRVLMPLRFLLIDPKLVT